MTPPATRALDLAQVPLLIQASRQHSAAASQGCRRQEASRELWPSDSFTGQNVLPENGVSKERATWCWYLRDDK